MWAELDLAAAARLLTGQEGEVLGVLDGRPLLVVDLDSGPPGSALRVPNLLPAVVVGISRADQPPAVDEIEVDVALCAAAEAGPGWVAGSIDSSLADICDRVEACPTAAVTLVHALRSGPVKTVDEGLLVESLAYSTLQSGPEFRTWLDGRRAPSRSEPDGEVVLAERRAGRLAITLNRPGVHNAYNAAMRDALARILALAAVDETIASIDLGGAGPSFCSGGDLDEFGSFPDPATAHLIRTGRSPAHLISLLSTKVTSRLHGWCVGSGIELPAFGARVVAAPDTRIRLPELEMGLIPGAGGTVSIPARIGRQRTAWLALTGRTISAETALAWGLADEIEAGA